MKKQKEDIIMSETNKENFTLEQKELNEVSGGAAALSPKPRFRVGQKVRAYCYFVGTVKEAYEDYSYNTWRYDVSDGYTLQKGVKESDIEVYRG